jgi:NCS1 nucleoside transporter family
MSLLWFSINLTANNIALGLLGPLVYDLGFTDSALCAVFGGLLGGAGAAYMSTWGPRSGNRTMVVARYFMGYYPSKLACALNVIIMLGYGLVDCLIGGQILSAVSGGSLNVVVGIIIVALISWIVAVFGMRIFHLYERWAGLPQLIVLYILFGVAGSKFDTSVQSVGDGATFNGDRLSLFSLCLSVPVAWAPSAADYFVYYPESTKPWKIFTMTFIGLGFANSMAYLLGVGMASGTFTHSDWNEAYSVSAGALLVRGYSSHGGFGKFCGVIVAMGLIANNIPGTYSAALGFQILGRKLAYLPRWLWVCICVVIYTACALGGRNQLFDIFENFLALMGFWVTIFLMIVIEKDVLFNRGKGYNWAAWEDKRKLRIGFAALTAFLVGYAGSVISMDQTWFVGPTAKLVGNYGADLEI